MVFLFLSLGVELILLFIKVFIECLIWGRILGKWFVSMM